MGMGSQVLPGGKLSAPLPCPALLCLGDWQCLLQLPAPSTVPESRFLAPTPGTDLPPPQLAPLFQTPFAYLSLSTRCFPKCALFVLVSFRPQ